MDWRAKVRREVHGIAERDRTGRVAVELPKSLGLSSWRGAEDRYKQEMVEIFWRTWCLDTRKSLPRK
jgi:hypothetical protein